MKNNHGITVLSSHLEHINRCFTSLTIDTKKSLIALQAAAKRNCNVSKGVINIIGLPNLLAAYTPSNAKHIASDDSSGYHIDLLKKHASGMPSRYLLAFFMPDNSTASQAVTIYSSIAPQTHLSAPRGQTIISIANHLLTDYDGLTLQNKIAERRICGAVACVTESKTRHPILLPYSVTFTQKLTQGGYHHA